MLTKVLETNDLKPGEARVVEVAGKTLALFNVGGRYYALDNSCLHRGGPLGDGELDGAIVTCPWHGWRWDVTTGANTNNPAIKAVCFPVKVDGSSVFVEV